MRPRIGKMGALALLASVLTACSTGVDKKSPDGGVAHPSERTGTLGLNLQPVSGITINSIHYAVTRGTPRLTISEGDLPTPGTSDNSSFGLPLPVATGYRLSLSAVAVESAGITCTGSYGPFDVAPNATTAFSFTLTCVNTNGGAVLPGLAIATEDCPRLVLDNLIAAPTVALTPGGTMALAAHAHDLDDPDVPIIYTWSIADPLVGSFTPATGATTTLTCQSLGDDVTVTVTADNGQCDKELSTSVSCLDFTCGNGIVDAAIGETCDTAIDPTCPLDCNRVCGDGFAEIGEECDSLGGSALCSSECEKVGTQACLDCENAGDCFELIDNCTDFSLGLERTVCYDVMQCIQETNCDDGASPLVSCFCGTLPAATCSMAPLTGIGSPNGPCKDLIVAGMQPVSTSAQVMSLLISTSRPAGGAMARLNCQKAGNSGICADACGFTAGGPAFP